MADLPLTLMHSSSLRRSVIALGLTYFTVVVFCRGELWRRESCIRWDMIELMGRERGYELESPFGCKLKVHFISDELQCFYMKHILTQ